jgi:hypothetical protein
MIDEKSTPKIDTAEKMLEVLRTFFNDDFIDFEERRKLWNVLTALRGPDNQDRESKLACVSLIRRAVAGQSFVDFGGYNRFDSEEDVEIRRRMPESHFQQHMRWAFAALDLYWHKVNYSRANAHENGEPSVKFPRRILQLCQSFWPFRSWAEQPRQSEKRGTLSIR